MKPGYDFHRAPDLPDAFGFWGHGPFHVFDIPWWTALISFLVGLGLYLIPTLIAYRRRHHNRAAIALLNILLGWTFFGWALALIWAATSLRPGPGLQPRERPGPAPGPFDGARAEGRPEEAETPGRHSPSEGS
jgi:hypothetical protein